MNGNNGNKLIVPGAKKIIDAFKTEIAQEFGVTLGKHTSSRDNGSVGGEMTKRLIAEAQNTRLKNSDNQQ